jgi:cytochrome P450
MQNEPSGNPSAQAVETVQSLPRARSSGCPFDPPKEFGRLREGQPVSRLIYPDGHLGWLVTSHALVCQLLADPRFSSRYELMHDPVDRGTGITEMPPAQPGDFIAMDPPEHTRYRKLLVGKFTVRRMRQLAERIEEVTAEHLDAMDRHGRSVDLVEAYAQPIPAMTICELLGVPYADRDTFTGHVQVIMSQESAPEEIGAATTGMYEFLGSLVQAKRANPTDDLLSDLTTSDLTDAELTGVGGLLLAAGLDTTANMIALGTFALLQNPDQLAALRADPGIIDQAVEELLRYLSVADPGARTALEDVELGGQLMKAGETVTYSMAAANRDPAKFANPDSLDLRRSTGGHLAFGHGVHQCLGQQLARIEMRVAFPALFERFPTLRLAVAPEEVPMRTNMNIYGVHRLPVTWDEA